MQIITNILAVYEDIFLFNLFAGFMQLHQVIFLLQEKQPKISKIVASCPPFGGAEKRDDVVMACDEVRSECGHVRHGSFDGLSAATTMEHYSGGLK